jgi:hypothetical protein
VTELVSRQIKRVSLPKESGVQKKLSFRFRRLVADTGISGFNKEIPAFHPQKTRVEAGMTRQGNGG